MRNQIDYILLNKFLGFPDLPRDEYPNEPESSGCKNQRKLAKLSQQTQKQKHQKETQMMKYTRVETINTKNAND